MSAGLRIVRMANFVAPSSGGLRTALHELGAGYRAAGHEPILLIPGARGEAPRDEVTGQGRVITLPGTALPGTGGYRVLYGRRGLTRLLDSLAPDRLEICDRTTLRWTGEWARRAGVPAIMVSHESVDGVLGTWGMPPPVARAVADRANLRTARAYSCVVCTTEWAEREFARTGAGNVVRAPLGVDLHRCHPGRRSENLRRQYLRAGRNRTRAVPPGEDLCLPGGRDGAQALLSGEDLRRVYPPDGTPAVLLALCSRLSPEKRPGRALDALRVLLRYGISAVLVVAGDGPLHSRMRNRARAERLPVVFAGHIADRDALATLQASADVVLAPGPAETFGLAALEALACGTPVVASEHSAVPAILGTAGAAAADNGEAFAAGVVRLLSRPERVRRAAARARAERYPWSAAVNAFLAAHAAPGLAPERAASGAGPVSAHAVSGLAPERAVSGVGPVSAHAVSGLAPERAVSGVGPVSAHAVSGLASECAASGFGSASAHAVVGRDRDPVGAFRTPAAFAEENAR